MTTLQTPSTTAPTAPVSPSTLLRITAIAGILCGAMLLTGGLTEAISSGKTPASSVLNGVAPAFGLLFLLGLALAQRDRLGRFGTAAFVTNFVGLALFGGVAFVTNFVFVYLPRAAIAELMGGPTLIAFTGAAILTLIGTVLVTIALLRAGRVPRFAAVLYGLGFSVVTLTAFLPSIVIQSAHVVTGLGLILLAIWDWRSAGRP